MRIRFLAAAAVAVACFWSSILAGAAGPDRITFTSFRPGNWDVYFANPASGRPPVRMTTDENLDYAQAPGADDDVKLVINEFLAAMANRDAKRLGALFAEDATLFYPSAPFPVHRLTGRPAIEAAWAAAFAAMPPPNGAEPPIQPLDLAVQRYGDVAIATFELASRPQQVGRRTFVLQRQSGAWKVLHLHASNRAE